MVDDGSTDSSGAICDEYAARYPQQALVFHKDNEGLLLARRDGFALAAGDYVMCVDSDDALVPGALALVATTAAKTSADVVRFGFTREESEAVPVESSIPFKLYSAEEKPSILSALCRSTSGSENPMWFKAIRRSCVGVDVDFSKFKGLTFAEDFCRPLPYMIALRRSASSMPLFITIAQVPELLEHMIRISTAMFADVSTWAKATRVAGSASTAVTISWSVSPLAGLTLARNMRNGWRRRAIRWVLMTSSPLVTLRVA